MSAWKVSRSSVTLKVSFWILAPLVLTTCSLSAMGPPPSRSSTRPFRPGLNPSTSTPRMLTHSRCAESKAQDQVPLLTTPPLEASVAVCLRHRATPPLEPGWRWRQPFSAGSLRAPRLGFPAGPGVSRRWVRVPVSAWCCWRACRGCCSRERGPPLLPCIPQPARPHICRGSCAYCGYMGRWAGPRWVCSPPALLVGWLSLFCAGVLLPCSCMQSGVEGRRAGVRRRVWVSGRDSRTSLWAVSRRNSGKRKDLVFSVARLSVDVHEWVRSQALLLTRCRILSFFFLRQCLFWGLFRLSGCIQQIFTELLLRATFWALQL